MEIGRVRVGFECSFWVERGISGFGISFYLGLEDVGCSELGGSFFYIVY